MIEEKWLSVEDFPRYLVSNLGNVYDTQIERLLVQSISKYGYHYVWLAPVPYAKFSITVHRLVAKTFIGIDSETDKQVNHKDGNKSNNCVWNLEWCTASENMRHAYASGLANAKSTRVRCVETGQEFKSITEAAQWCDVEYKRIMRARDNPNKTVKGFHWVTVDQGGEAQ